MANVTISPLELFQLAGIVGKSVIVLLLAASIWCWVLIIEGVVGAIRLNAAVRRWRKADVPPQLQDIVTAGTTAADNMVRGESIGDMRQRVIEAMNRRARAVIVSAEGGLANLAVISSVAPFIGLFGTVWGIMSSFTAIAAAKDTSLAVVAPGIAEALATTAIGLFTAIPASIGYTRLGSAFGAIAMELSGLIEEAALTQTVRHIEQHIGEEVT
jgi:biopolymer transport protein ExbB/TolQ